MKDVQWYQWSTAKKALMFQPVLKATDIMQNVK